jgi:LmbE family N-acetylglucosaminyl deacetylase
MDLTNLKVNRALVVGAHPDDEVLGCGGLIARLVETGCTVRVITLSGVTTSRPREDAARAGHITDEMGQAMQALGVHSFKRFDIPDNRFDTRPLLELVQYLEAERESFAPSLIITHDAGDLNVDHRLTNQAVLTAFRPRPEEAPFSIWAFEILSSTEWQDPALKCFQPQIYLDISRQLETKLKAMQCYASELRDYPHPRSLEGIRLLARLRGLEVCLTAAEAFRLIRHVA